MDFHEARTILGIPADSAHDEVARAYRRRARATHPDVSADPDAAAQFDAVSTAYRVLSDQPDVEVRIEESPPPRPVTVVRRRPRLDGYLIAVGPVRIQPSPRRR
jgi:curved DNA-binding protein CbpA